MIRRFGETYRPDKVYKARSGVYAILSLENNLLVTHQGLSSQEVQLPGGGIDPGEQPLHALHREILEETGWIISKPIKLGIYGVLLICLSIIYGQRKYVIFIRQNR